MNLDLIRRHIDHPDALHLSYYQANGNSTLTCYSCKQSVSGWIYGCEPCKFAVHFHCLRLPKNTRLTITDLCNHRLPLRTNLSKAFKCLACQQTGYGMCFTCDTCKWDLHIRCAALELKLDTNVHSLHTLRLNSPRESKSFSCSVCGNIRRNQWRYHCETCNIDICLACVRPKPMAKNKQFVTVAKVKKGTSKSPDKDGNKGSSRVPKGLSQGTSSLSLSKKNKDKLPSFRSGPDDDDDDDEDDDDDDNDHRKRHYSRHKKESGGDDDDDDDYKYGPPDMAIKKDNDDDDEDDDYKYGPAMVNEKDNDDDDEDDDYKYGPSTKKDKKYVVDEKSVIDDNEEDDEVKYITEPEIWSLWKSSVRKQ